MTCPRCKRTAQSLARVRARGRDPFEADLCRECLAAWNQFERRAREQFVAQQRVANIRVEWSWGFGTGTSYTTGNG